MYWSGFSIIRWQSSGTSVTLRNDLTTGGPMVMLGTKWPSITSTCSSVPPPASAARASSARRAKSADKIDGASSIMQRFSGAILACILSVRFAHKPPTMFARPEIFGGVPTRRLGAQAGVAAKRLGCLRNGEHFDAERRTISQGIQSNINMKARPLLLRALLSFVLATLCFMLLAASAADATPVDAKLPQMVKDALRPETPYIPARAGWDGPMAKNSAMAQMNVTQMLAEANHMRAMREAIREAAIPDPRIAGGLLAVIFLLRELRQRQRRATVIEIPLRHGPEELKAA